MELTDKEQWYLFDDVAKELGMTRKSLSKFLATSTLGISQKTTVDPHIRYVELSKTTMRRLKYAIQNPTALTDKWVIGR